jgi:hypothetical protein
MRAAFGAIAAGACLAGLAGCQGRPIRGEEGPPKAVVLCAAGQDELSSRIARALNEKGYDVVRRSTPIARSRSSMAVYDVRGNPDRVEDLTRLFDEELAFPIEVLLFQQHATGGNAVVIWLAPGAAPAK